LHGAKVKDETNYINIYMFQIISAFILSYNLHANQTADDKIFITGADNLICSFSAGTNASPACGRQLYRAWHV
jgi:hypothetical protein